MQIKKIIATAFLTTLGRPTYGQTAVDSAIEEGVLGFFSALTLVLVIFGVQWAIKLFRGSSDDLYNRREQSSPKQSVKQQIPTLAPIATTFEPDTKFYSQALSELDGDARDSGIWAKAYAEADNEEASRKLYIKLRAEDLMRKQVEKRMREQVEERKIKNRLPELISWAHKSDFVIQGRNNEDELSPWKIRKLPFGIFEEFEDDLSFVKHLEALRESDSKK